MQILTNFSISAFSPGHKVEAVYQPAPDLRLPLLICRGAAAGRRLVAVAGVHGDEYEGMQAVWRAFRALDPGTMRGDFIGVPVAHVAAYEASARESPLDGKNLARTFPGLADGSVTERLAHYLFEEVVLGADFLIDLHSGGMKYHFLPLVGYYEMDNQASTISLDMARRIDLPYRWKLPHTAGVLSYEACRRGIPAVGAEYFGEGKLNAGGVAAYVAGVMSCLDFLGIAAAATAPRRSIPTAQTVITGDWLLATRAGLFVSEVRTGERVRRGASLARVEALSGDILETFSAPHAGVVMGTRTVAPINPGDWAVAVTKEDIRD